LTREDFEHYRHQAGHDLMDLNEQCENGFRLAEWPRYAYDLETASLVFSRDGVPHVIAKVQLVGTIDGEEKTWRWGWADLSVPDVSTRRMEELRAFGEREGIAELTAEALLNEKYLGWEMTAVAAKVLGAKGAYRCPRAEGGTAYFVYTEIAFAPPPETATIECSLHGRGFPAYLCSHLVAEPAQKWFSEEPTLENRWPDAWCETCDRIFLEEGEWNERTGSRIQVKTLCHRCYEGKRLAAL
jgi:hypothetical protein